MERLKILIVAKTRMGGSACVGAIAFDGRSLRLRAADERTNDHANQAYQIGDVWEIEGHPLHDRPLPHSEDFRVKDKCKLPPLTDIRTFIEDKLPPYHGAASILYEELLQQGSSGALYITKAKGVPAFSTTFWRPAHDLLRVVDGKRIRYRVEDGSNATFVFVGYQEPPERLPAGSLLRISLAHWWQPHDRPNQEPRCYAQLSGWFLSNSVLHLSDDSPSAAVIDKIVQPERSPTQLLQTVFGYQQFRPMQKRIIDNILTKRDTLIILPTGGGKSLCYQLPALLFEGLTVVISPLVALMEDQVMQLKSIGIAAEYLNHTVSHDSYVRQMQRVRQGQIKLLYLSPETLLQPEILVMLDQSNVACVAVDEAHCISSWGHDFRPEYRQLARVRERYRSAVWLALTATATPRVQDDIRAILHLTAEDSFVGSFDRPNLFISASHKINTFEQLQTILKQHLKQSGIIYCGTRKTVDTLAAKLNDLGYRTRPYHAGLDSQTRRANQTAFIRDNVQIIVATIAFGLGVDKPNVRFVVHTYLPKNIESYYQHIGRAGRDGLPANCHLLYNFGDVKRQKDRIDQGIEAERIGRAARLQVLVDWAESKQCRRRPILTYFGERSDSADCGNCDNCTRQAEPQVDISRPAQKIFACVYRTGQLYGAAYVIKVLRGSRSSVIFERGHNKLSTYGIGHSWNRAAWQHMMRQLIDQALLVRDPNYGSIKLTSAGIRAMKGEQPVHGTIWRKARPTTFMPQQSASDHDLDLFERLRIKRKELADAANVPPYVIFSDRTLLEMATMLPSTKEAFYQLHGVGLVKLEKYADIFLGVMHGTETPVVRVSETSEQQTRPFSAEISF